MSYVAFEERVLHALIPGQGAALWIGLIVTYLIIGHRSRFLSFRNLLVAFLMAGAVVMVDIHRFASRPESTDWCRWMFTALFTFTGLVTVGSLVGAMTGRARRLEPSLSRGQLCILSAALVLLSLCVAIGRYPEDVGKYTNLGAQRWRETGTIPYGDAKLRGADSPAHGAAATYGPVMYALHIPFQVMLDVPVNPPEADPGDEEAYPYGPDVWMKPSMLANLVFHLLGMAGLYFAGRRVCGREGALALICLWVGSAYMIGVGGDERIFTLEAAGGGLGPVGGVSWMSHVAPVGVVLLAFWALNRPLLSGVLLGLAFGVLFFPAFLVPAFFGWNLWRKEGPWRFLIGFAATAGAIFGATLWFMDAPDLGTAVRQFLECTVQHQEGFAEGQYGLFHFSFWGNWPELAEFWQRPLAGTSALAKPAFLGFAAISAATFFFARGRTESQFALLIAAVMAAVQLWKTNAAGTYVEWYYPFLLIGILGGRAEPPVEGSFGEPTPDFPSDRTSLPVKPQVVEEED